MSDNGRNSEGWIKFSERVGVPAIILLVILYGLYVLLTPVLDATVRFMIAQTQLLSGLSEDIKLNNEKADEAIRTLRKLKAEVKKRND